VPFAHATSVTYLQGRATSDKSKRIPSLTTAFDQVSGIGSTTTGGGYFVMGGIVDGARDRVTISGSGFENYLGPSFYAGVEPITAQEHLIVESTSLDAWATILDADGTLDATKGVVFGEVVDALGLPVRSATVSISPGQGDVFYFNDTGTPDPLAIETGTNGRYLILDVPPGNVAVNAHIGKSLTGRAYGRVAADKVTGLPLAPTRTLSGTARDEMGSAVPGALIAWDFDTDFAAFADGAGGYLLTGLADGLDLTPQCAALRSVAAGELRFCGGSRLEARRCARGCRLSERGAYSRIGAFGIRKPVGMIVGRVLAPGRDAAAGATGPLGPPPGPSPTSTLRAPDPALVRTSASGEFIVFNVPPGTVVLRLLGPDPAIGPPGDQERGCAHRARHGHYGSSTGSNI
jgi:hypothetical protein